MKRRREIAAIQRLICWIHETTQDSFYLAKKIMVGLLLFTNFLNTNMVCETPI
jgi:hypothetical protein